MRVWRCEPDPTGSVVGITHVDCCCVILVASRCPIIMGCPRDVNNVIGRYPKAWDPVFGSRDVRGEMRFWDYDSTVCLRMPRHRVRSGALQRRSAHFHVFQHLSFTISYLFSSHWTSQYLFGTEQHRFIGGGSGAEKIFFLPLLGTLGEFSLYLDISWNICVLIRNAVKFAASGVVSSMMAVPRTEMSMELSEWQARKWIHLFFGFFLCQCHGFSRTLWNGNRNISDT